MIKNAKQRVFRAASAEFQSAKLGRTRNITVCELGLKECERQKHTIRSSNL